MVLRFLVIIALALLPSLALAADVTQYVTAGCGNNGDGTSAACAGSPAGAGAFNTFANWESQNTNLVSGDTNLTVEFSGTFASGGTLDGWTTDATRRILLNGLVISSTDYGALLTISDSYVTIRGASISKTAAGVNIQLLNGTFDNFTLERSVIFHGPSVTRDSGLACLQGDASGTTSFRNNFFHSCLQSSMYIAATSGSTISIDNNTFYDSQTYGLLAEVASGTPTWNIYNNISVSSGTADYSISPGSGTYNHDNNIASDTSSPDDAHDSQTITFVSAPSDLHLDPGETDAIDMGTDRSGAGFSNDYDDDTRSGSWDIGADEIVASGSVSIIPLLTETIGY